MITFTMPAAALKALTLFSAVKDIRYYLQGIYVDLSFPAGPRLVSTDGHRLLVIDLHKLPGVDLQPVDTLPSPCPGGCIIPLDLIKAAKPGKNGDVRITLSDIAEVDGQQQFQRCTIAQIDGPEMSGKPIVGRFPDWSRIVPATIDSTMIPADIRCYNYRYVSDVIDALQLLNLTGSKYPGLPVDAGCYLPAGSNVPSIEEMRSTGTSWHLTAPEVNGVRWIVAAKRI